MQTYNLDAQIGESSACATALLSGVKANFETVGLDGGGKFEDCFSSLHSRVDSIMTWAQHEGILIFVNHFVKWLWFLIPACTELT